MTPPIGSPKVISALFICVVLATVAYFAFGAERVAWNSAQRQDTAEAYHHFMTRFPTSLHAEEAARRKANGIKAQLATALQHVQSGSCDSATPLLDNVIRVDSTNAYALNGAAYCSLDEPHSMESLERALDYLKRAAGDSSNQFSASGPAHGRVVQGRGAAHAFVLIRPADQASGSPSTPAIRQNTCAVVDMLALKRFPPSVQIPTFCLEAPGGR